ncbi:MAG: response regulator [Candidatus Paceibacterota bacterium]|jgi:CheY-like chemotaxis protein|nr:response regulator [Candidatus Paceibacterota bacterium]
MEKAKKILIVEDEPMIRKALVERFSEEKNLTVMSAKDGKEGLEAAFREHPDFILLDIIMPIMNGLEMLNHLREDEWGKDVQVMILSNLADTEKKAEATAKGVKYFIIKSNVNISSVVEKVVAVMDGKELAEDDI